MYVIMAIPNYGPGNLFVSNHGDGWCEANNFPWTTNRLEFAKKWDDPRPARQFIYDHNLDPEKFRVVQFTNTLVALANDYRERTMEK